MDPQETKPITLEERLVAAPAGTGSGWEKYYESHRNEALRSMPADPDRLQENTQAYALHLGLMAIDVYHPLRKGLSAEDQTKLLAAHQVAERALRRQEGGLYAKFYARAAAAV